MSDETQDDGLFEARYYEHVAAEDLASWSAAERASIAAQHRLFARDRPVGAPRVRVRTSEVDARHSTIEIITDDMPFLVDSVTAEIVRHGLAIVAVIHPQFIVQRDIAGQLLDVPRTLDVREIPADAVVESWMHIEATGPTQLEAQQALERDILGVLRDVRDAVEDWQRMRALALSTATAIDIVPPPSVPADEAAEVADFLRWLADDDFTFLGSRDYRLIDVDGEPAIIAVPASGLGILRGDRPKPTLLSELPPRVRARVRDRELLIVTKTNAHATVHRSVHMDYVGVKMFDADGAVVGERRFLGLFTSESYAQRLTDVPVLRRKASRVLELAGYLPMSHSGKDLAQILQDHPRDDLFQISGAELLDTALGVLHLLQRPRLRLFLHRDSYGRNVSCLVYLPRERYNTEVRMKMRAILLDALGGIGIEDTFRVAESVLARVHFVVQVAPKSETDAGADVAGVAGAEFDREAIERRLIAATRTWQDDYADAVAAAGLPDGAAAQAALFPQAYKDEFPAAQGLHDLRTLESLAEEDLEPQLYEARDDAGSDLALKLYRRGAPVSLSRLLPMLQAMGVEVIDERPYEIGRREQAVGWIYHFGLRYPATSGQADRNEARADVDADRHEARADGDADADGDAGAGAGAGAGADADADSLHERFHDAIVAAWRGHAEIDGFQALVLLAGLTWRQAAVIRAFAKYLRQAGTHFSQESIEATMRANPRVVRLLAAFFDCKFDPAIGDDRAAAQQRLQAEIGSALDAVTSLDEDRILRAFFGLAQATLRTNYWQRDAQGTPKPYLALKFDSTAVPDLPEPRPWVEIFVYSARVEGVHLRFGPVARGGIRYSDRRDDYRNEVLGLAKTQTVKNAVIVPVGSKGGFVVKRPREDRTSQRDEVVTCYRMFIAGLLDLTDNLALGADGRVSLPPPNTVRHDGDDSYLVVAADKGTATFSDLANEVAADYGFWLGDAFASGGSAGYDHKAMGITARGAWESVTRHFRELGLDPANSDFRCVGIGDMSGDVFGNGMLLSAHIRLVAAFDHRHIFIDPEPDAARSLLERQRLFAIAGSSWADYDPSLISAGGGVWPRSAKSIPLSAQAAAALGVDNPRPLAPTELMQAILRAPVDLLWNGGIGTYVKAHTETNAEVADRSNDAIRVDGRDLRCRVVGEGGNLGFTQRARVEFAMAGGRINTDAIDNSAGVDTSDHEVNIKILLDVAQRARQFDRSERDALLASMTSEVASLVLADNYAQNLALTCAEAQAASVLNADAGCIDWLEKSGELVRELEQLPDAATIRARRAAGLGLTRPELAVLLAYAKTSTTAAIAASTVPDEPFAHDGLVGYFPRALRDRFPALLVQHPLHREIIATALANALVNVAGSTFVYRLAGETSAPVPDIVRAYAAITSSFDIETLWHDIEALDGLLYSGDAVADAATETVVAADVQTALLLDVRQFLEDATRWLLANRRPPLDVAEVIAAFAPGLAQVLSALPQFLRGSDATRLDVDTRALTDGQVPAAVARRTTVLSHGVSALVVVDIATRLDVKPAVVAEVHFALADALRLSQLSALIGELPSDSKWRALAGAAARDDLAAAHAELTTEVLLATDASLTPQVRIEQWRAANEVALARTTGLLDGVANGESTDLAALSVALRELRALIRSAALPPA